MGRSPCCDKVGLKKGPWTPEEDKKLLAYIEEHGHGSWRALPAKAGLQRCGKSCRLRWTNYLRPDIKRGKFSLQEEQSIIQLHALLGNRWSAIATHLPKRTDNEIKNYWNTHLKKRLAKMGIDPVTHKPKNDLLSNDGVQTKHAANLSHMAQWESARLEAEARLVRESKLRSSHNNNANSLLLGLSSKTDLNNANSNNTTTTSSSNGNKNSGGFWSHVAWSKSTQAIESPRTVIEFVGSSTASNNSEAGAVKEEGSDEQQDWNNHGHHEEGIDQNSLSFSATNWNSTSNNNTSVATNNGNTCLGIDMNVAEEDQLGFTSLLLNNSDDRSLSEGGCEDSENGRSGSDELYQDNENYWNSILNLVNSSPSDSPMF